MHSGSAVLGVLAGAGGFSLLGGPVNAEISSGSRKMADEAVCVGPAPTSKSYLQHGRHHGRRQEHQGPSCESQ